MKHLGCVTYPIPGCGIDVIKSEFPNEASVGTHKGFLKKPDVLVAVVSFLK